MRIAFIKFAMKTISTLLTCLCLLLLVGCSKNEYDYKALGFSSADEMQAAFQKGYHTKKKLDEMSPAAAPTTTTAPDSTPQPVVTSEVKQEPIASSAQDNTPFAPSFDCSKASNKIERLICDDRELAKLDVELSKAYQIARDASTDKDQLKKDQISWVKLSRACDDKACVKSAFELRLKQLSK
jgi:uncharacterized protein YecT (DUF1311 family)